jgi:hypothetical protein
MAAIEIVFSGLIMFSAPGKDGRVAVATVTGDAWHNEVHFARIQIGGAEEKELKDGEVVIEGPAGAVTITEDFNRYIPSVTAALQGAGLENYRPDGCVSEPNSKCKRVRNYLYLEGGTLTAEPYAQDKKAYCFKAGTAGSYCLDRMAHAVKWTGEASAITIGGKRTALTAPTTIYITNHPVQSTERHFGVYRHLWGASLNGTEDGWPLPISGTGLLEGLAALTSKRVSSDKETLDQVLGFMTAQRPQFCPPARQ